MSKDPAPGPADLRLLDPDGSFRARLLADQARLAASSEQTLGFAVIVHQLAGAAGTFGYAGLGAVAMALDDRLNAGETLTPADRSRLLSVLAAALRAPQRSG